MQRMEDKWLDKVKDKLSGYEVEVPEGLWEAVDPSRNIPSCEPGKIRMMEWRRLAAWGAAAVVAIVGAVGLLYVGNDDKELSLVAYDSPREVTRETASGIVANIASAELPGVDKGKKPTPRHRNKTAPLFKQCGHEEGEALSIVSTREDGLEPEETGYDSAEANGEETVDSAATASPVLRLPLLSSADDALPPRRDRTARRGTTAENDGKMALGMLTSAGMATDRRTGGDFATGNKPGWPGSIATPGNDFTSGNKPNWPNLDLNPGPNVDSNNPGTDSSDSNQYGPDPEEGNDKEEDNDKKADPPHNEMPTRSEMMSQSHADNERNIPDEDTDEISHRMPVKIGLTLLYRFNERLGLETGLVYTNLSSDVRYGANSKSEFSSGKQSLHYIGLPVNVKYIPLASRWVNLYLSGGGMVDKCVSATLKGKYALPSHDRLPEKTISLRQHPFQFSVNLAAGVQFNITPNLGLYAEPGISYYFNDGSKLSTYYKQHPWNFNVNVGIRISLGDY